MFFKYSEDYTPVFVQDEKIDNQNCRVIELWSKTEDIFIKYMKIWINLKLSLPVKIEQVDINGNTITYLLSNIQVNNTIDDNLFVYKIPESVEIIDMR
jgi:outer membrane lipoprotein-sorting protein